MLRDLTAVYEHYGGWWMAYVKELPGANTEGKTLKETSDNLDEAIQLIIEANHELALRTTQPTKESS